MNGFELYVIVFLLLRILFEVSNVNTQENFIASIVFSAIIVWLNEELKGGDTE